MARMYSRRKGKAGSKNPLTKIKPSWVRYSDKEVELLITKLAKEGKNPSQIGMHLRDGYGIPKVKALSDKSITTIMKNKKVLPQLPEDLMALMKKSISEKKHIESHKQDMTAKRGLLLTESKIRRLVKYYKRTGKIAQNWEFDPQKLRILIE